MSIKAMLQLIFLYLFSSIFLDLPNICSSRFWLDSPLAEKFGLVKSIFVFPIRQERVV